MFHSDVLVEIQARFISADARVPVIFKKAAQILLNHPPVIVLRDIIIYLSRPLVHRIADSTYTAPLQISIGSDLLLDWQRNSWQRRVEPGELHFAHTGNVFGAVHEAFSRRAVFKGDDLRIWSVRMRFDGFEFADALSCDSISIPCIRREIPVFKLTNKCCRSASSFSVVISTPDTPTFFVRLSRLYFPPP